MKFKAKISQFQALLQRTMPAIPRKSTLPVLEHLHFTLDDGHLQVIATDQDITIKSRLEVEAEAQGAILVPARKLNDIIKALGSTGEFEFSTNDETFEIIIITPLGKYSLKGLPAEEYIDLPELYGTENQQDDPDGTIISAGSGMKVKFEKNAIKRAAAKTVFAVSQDEFRPAMTGVLFEFTTGNFSAVSTDSFRLVQVKIHDENAGFPDETDIIVPSRAVDILSKVDSDVVMSDIQTQGKITHLRFDAGDTVFISKIIDERFPPYESVLPPSSDYQATVDLKDITSAIRRIAIVTSKISNQIRVKLTENNMFITGEDEESGDYGNESVPCDYSGPEMTIGFNYVYLEQALDNLFDESKDDKVVFNINEPTKPIIIKPINDDGNLLMLIMPVRLAARPVPGQDDSEGQE